jgi:ADP-ribose pyrophosphatase YjhB (NUDIX family)
MATPEFIAALRRKIGNDLLWLPGVMGAVFNAEGQVLLGRRSDNGRWTLITGILEPGEEPGPGLLREIEEETGVVAELERLVAVNVFDPVTFPNGDRAEFLNVVFRCRYVSGEARVNDDESTDVRWFPLDGLPDMPAKHLQGLRWALEAGPEPYFKR